MKGLHADVRDEMPKLLGLARRARVRLTRVLQELDRTEAEAREGGRKVATALPDEEWRELFRWVIDAHVRVSSEQRQWAKQQQGEAQKFTDEELMDQIRKVVAGMSPAEREAILGGEH